MREEMTIIGDLRQGRVEEWVRHRADKLSLNGRILRHSDREVTVDVSGPEELLDAMAIACSLGPSAALIETVERKPMET